MNNDAQRIMLIGMSDDELIDEALRDAADAAHDMSGAKERSRAKVSGDVLRERMAALRRAAEKPE